EIELRLIAEETCFVDGKIFEQQRKLGASFAAREQSVVAVKRIELTNFEPALKAVLQKVRAALVEKHAALLVNERLQKFEFRFGELHLGGQCSHEMSGDPAVRLARQKWPALLCGEDGVRGLLESFEFRPMQKLGNIQQNDE